MKDCGSFHAPSPPFSTRNGLPLGLTKRLFSSSSRKRGAGGGQFCASCEETEPPTTSTV